MTRQEALSAVAQRAAGLDADDAGVRRLLERISQADQAEALRAALTELGARAVLEARE
jgi:hypothetical protein